MECKDYSYIDPETGNQWVVKDGRTYIRDENGELVSVVFSDTIPYDYQVRSDQISVQV